MRTVCAYSLWFSDQHAERDVWNEVIAWVENWHRNAIPGAALPARWGEGIVGTISFARDHSLECCVASIDDTIGPLRELRWRFADAADPSLLWSIDAALLPHEGAILTLVLRIASADFELVPARFQLRSPRVIRSVVERGDVHIGSHRIQLAPEWVVATRVPDLTVELLDQSRRHPIVVVSPEPNTDDAYAVDPDLIASHLAGLASIYVLGSRWAGFALTDELGKRLSCYNGAVRVYWPRFHHAADQYSHPLWLPPQIYDMGTDEDFARHLLGMVAAVASFRFVEPDPMRAFRTRIEEARVGRMRADRANGYDELFDEYVRLDAHARALRVQLDKAAEEVAALRAELAAGWKATSADVQRGRRSTSDQPDIESVVAAVEEAQRQSSHVIYLPDAFESARDSPFKQPARALSALLAVEDVAAQWAEQLDGGAPLGPRRDAFRERGFEYKDDISPTSAGKWGEDYTYRYNGRRIVFGPHITIGAKSPDRCLSIHMFWDDTTRKVVIAHVGRHKKNTLT